MDDCIEQMLEMEQPDELYSVGRTLRGVFRPCPPGASEDDPHLLLGQVDAADRDA